MAALLLAGLGACSAGRRDPPVALPDRAVIHEVRRGETLYGIGLTYGVSYRDIARANLLVDPSLIRVGQRLVIPMPDGLRFDAGRFRASDLDILPRRAAAAPWRAPDGASVPRPVDAPAFAWPLASGSVSSCFGPRASGFHDGIDIAAPEGAAVLAAADGEVAYSDPLPGYGNLIVLRHGRGYTTMYAHNRSHRVRAGERVRRGQAIATVGQSGRTSGANLHFEVRRDNLAYDPLDFLPPAEQAVGERRGADGG